MDMTIGDLGVIFLAIPLLGSLVLNGWEFLWDRTISGPLSLRGHSILMAIQIGVVIALATGGGLTPVIYAATALYAAMAAGALILKVQKGAVDCGCWGSSGGQITYRLVAFDLLLAGIGIATALGPRSWNAAEGTLLILSSAALTLFFILAVPEWRYAWRGVRHRATPYRKWATGHSELKV